MAPGLAAGPARRAPGKIFDAGEILRDQKRGIRVGARLASHWSERSVALVKGEIIDHVVIKQARVGESCSRRCRNKK